jgi:hypothetical protein
MEVPAAAEVAAAKAAHMAAAEAAYVTAAEAAHMAEVSAGEMTVEALAKTTAIKAGAETRADEALAEETRAITIARPVTIAVVAVTRAVSIGIVIAVVRVSAGDARSEEAADHSGGGGRAGVVAVAIGVSMRVAVGVMVDIVMGVEAPMDVRNVAMNAVGGVMNDGRRAGGGKWGQRRENNCTKRDGRNAKSTRRHDDFPFIPMRRGASRKRPHLNKINRSASLIRKVLADHDFALF